MSLLFATSIKPALALVAKDYKIPLQRMEKNFKLSDPKLDYSDSAKMEKILTATLQKKLNSLNKFEQNNSSHEQRKKLLRQKRLSVLAATFKKRKQKRKQLYETIQKQIDDQKNYHLQQQKKAQEEMNHHIELDMMLDMEVLLNFVLAEQEQELLTLTEELSYFNHLAMEVNLHHHSLLHALEEIDLFLNNASPQHVLTRMSELEQNLNQMGEKSKKSLKADSLRFQHNYLKEALGTSPKPSLTPPHHLKETLAQRHKEKQASYQYQIKNRLEKQHILKQEMQSVRETLQNLQAHKKEMALSNTLNPFAIKPSMTPIKKAAASPKLSPTVPKTARTAQEKKLAAQWKAPTPSPFHR